MCGSSAPKAPDYTAQNNNLLKTTSANNLTAATNWNNAAAQYNTMLTGGTYGGTGGTGATTTYTTPAVQMRQRETRVNSSGGPETTYTNYWTVDGNNQQFSREADARAWAEANRIGTSTPGTPGTAGTTTPGFQKQIGDFLTAVNGTGIKNLWDNPATANVNENAYDRLFKQGNDIKTAFQRLTAPEQIELTRRVNGGGGQVLEITDLPTLTALNTDLYTSLGADLERAFAQLETLKGQRQTEEQRIGTFGRTLTDSLSALQSGLGRIDYSNLAGITQAQQERDRLKRERAGFSSDILGQINGGDFGLQDRWGAVDERLRTLMTNRQNEEKRIKDYEKSMLAQSDAIRGMLGGLTIADKDKMDDLRKQIEAVQLGAGRFSSKLDYDLSQELAEFGGLSGKLNDLYGQRTTEEGRVNQLRTNVNNDARNLQGMLANAGIYDQGTIDQYGRMVGDLKSTVGSFSSPLGGDLSGVDLAGLEAAYASLQERRNAALNPLTEKLGTLGQGIGSFALEDEAGRATRMSELADLRSQLSSFTGGGVDDMRTRLSGYLTDLNTQATGLSTRRGEVNTQAEALLKAIKDGSYYDTSDVAKRQGEAQQLKALVDQFGVTAAGDEMSAIEAFLNGQTSRIEGDQQAVQAEQAKATSLAQQMLSGNPLEGMLGAQNLGDDEIRQLLAMLSQEDDAVAQRMTGTFSQMMGA